MEYVSGLGCSVVLLLAVGLVLRRWRRVRWCLRLLAYQESLGLDHGGDPASAP